MNSAPDQAARSDRHLGGRGITRREPFSLQGFVDSYQPRREPLWPRIRDFVLRCVARSGAESYTRANRITRAVTFLAIHCVQSGIELTEELALHPDRIDHFAVTWPGNKKSLKDYRSELLLLGAKVTVNAPYRPRVTLRRTPLDEPYTDMEMEALLWAVRTQATDARRQSGEAVVLLGRGVGLDGRWIARVGPSDVQLSAAGRVLVAVPEPSPRLVPVDPPWDVALLHLAERVTTDCLVGHASTASNRAAGLIRELRMPSSVPALSARRLRSTWLVDQLIAGIPLPHLLEAAGLETPNQLTRLLPHASARIGPPAWALEARHVHVHVHSEGRPTDELSN